MFMDQVNRKLLKPKDVRAYHPSLNEQRLARLRLEGGGPEFIKLGRSVYYDAADIGAWLDKNRRRSTSDPGATPVSPSDRTGGNSSTANT
jgi:hypothetical protein